MYLLHSYSPNVEANAYLAHSYLQCNQCNSGINDYGLLTYYTAVLFALFVLSQAKSGCLSVTTVLQF